MNEIIERKLKDYTPQDSNEEINALKEISQEIILFALSETDFFDKAFFLGGTCLRIVYGLERFSEDLDFSTIAPDPKFDFDFYMDKVIHTLKAYGLEMHISKKKDDTFVKSRELKEDSLKWKLSFPSNQKLKKIMIKLEIDSNPPEGAVVEDKFLDFPQLHRVSVANMPTLFAGKLHALLSRSYTKGRDWYDFLWYIKNHSGINLLYLAHALEQMGPFKRGNLKVTRKILLSALDEKIRANDWEAIRKDVARFLKPHELKTLELWGEKLFLDRLAKLEI